MINQETTKAADLLFAEKEQPEEPKPTDGQPTPNTAGGLLKTGLALFGKEAELPRFSSASGGTPSTIGGAGAGPKPSVPGMGQPSPASFGAGFGSRPGMGGGPRRALAPGPMPGARPLVPRPPRQPAFATLAGMNAFADPGPAPPTPASPPAFTPPMPAPMQRQPAQSPIPELPELGGPADPMPPAQPAQPAQPEAPAQPAQPSLDANMQQLAGQTDQETGFTPPGGSGAGGTKPGAGPPAGADYGFGGAAQGALGAGREFMGQLGDSFSGMGQRAQDAMSRITGGARDSASNLMQSARGLFGDQGQPGQPAAGPRGPEFDAAVADMGQRFQADQAADAQGGAPDMAAMDRAREERESAFGQGMALGGGPETAPEEDPYAGSRFREQLRHYGGLSEEASAGTREQRRAQAMLDYYKKLEGTGDRLARRATANIDLGTPVSEPTMNYLARRGEFERGADPDVFNANRSLGSERILSAGLQEQLGAARQQPDAPEAAELQEQPAAAPRRRQVW